jgi:alkylation response protein AidB-like acyl-CoA dehydrogenase
MHFMENFILRTSNLKRPSRAKKGDDSMNFDFSLAEQAMFKDILDKMKEYSDWKDLLAILGKTPYLKLGLETPEGFGGISLMGAMEILASLSPSLYLSVEMSTRLFGGIVATWGNDIQKERWLTPLMKGQFLGAVALSEDSLNVDNDPLKTIGIQDENILNITGEKPMWSMVRLQTALQSPDR